MALHYVKSEAKIGFGKEKEVKFVGRRRLADPFSLERLAKEISHETGLQQATAEIVLRYMVLAVEDAIKDGRSVDLGIGTLSPSISTVAADDAADVKIRRKKLVFRASAKMREIVQAMSVKLISDEEDPDDNDNDNPDDNDSDNPDDNDSDDGGGTQGGSGSGDDQQGGGDEG